MATLEVFFCNLTYGEQWYADIKDSNSAQYAVIEAIIEAVAENDGGDITQDDVLSRSADAAEYVARNEYRIIPTDGLELKHNGTGIRHAKYAPSKSVAILWEKIGDTIFVTFDDHAPVRYHRAIRCLRDLRLGKQNFPMRSRNSRSFIDKLWSKGKRMHKGFNPRDKHYK